MNHIKTVWIYLTTIILGFSSCEVGEFTDLTDLPFIANASLEKFVTVGDGYMAGYMDGALYSQGQENSVGAILAKQLNSVQPFEFNQPTVDTEVGFSGTDADGNPLGRLRLVNVDGQIRSLPIAAGRELSLYTGSKDSLNNFAVPNAKMIDALIPGYGRDNFHFGRFAQNITSSSIVTDVSSVNPTFFAAWFGISDVFNFAAFGATPSTSGLEENDMTSALNFGVALDNMLNNLVNENGARGLIGNIPNILDFPYFTDIPFNSLPTPTRTDSLRLVDVYIDVNTAIVTWNQVVRNDFNLTEQEKRELQRPFIIFREGTSDFVIEDETLSDAVALLPNGTVLTIPKIRNMNRNELVSGRLTQEQIAAGFGGEIPLPSEYVLTEDEITLINERITQLNGVIQTAASVRIQLALVDLNQVFQDVKDKELRSFDGIPFEFNKNPNTGMFSADGIHLNARGNSHIANWFIVEANQAFSGNIPLTDPNDFPGNEEPL